MKALLVWLITLASISATGASAADLPVPGKAARALARHVIDQSGDRFRIPPDSARRQLIHSLIGQIRAYKSASCDPVAPACRTAAETIATEKAAEYAALRDAAFEDGYAALFESQLSAQDIAAASTFVQARSGAKFASALTSSEMPPMFVLSYVSRRLQEYEDGLYDRFLKDTAPLPRRVLRVPPPIWSPTSPNGQKRP